jgi:integrase
MALTDVKVKNAKLGAKPYKLADERGLYLLVQPGGSKLWRLNYRYAAKQKTLAFGGYPDTTLAKARELRDDARRLLANGADPGEVRKAEKASAAGADTFEAIAREWHGQRLPTLAPTTADKFLRRMELDVFPWLGTRPVGDIKAPEVLQTLRRIEGRGANDLAHRVHVYCSQVFRFAVATGRAERDPCSDLRGALAPYKPTHHAAIIEPKAAGELLRAIQGYTGGFVTRCAMRLAPLVFVRPGELRQAEWSELDLDKGEWRIPGHKMKMRDPHIVPLSVQAVAILREVQPLTGAGRFVFPAERTADRPMSENTINAALRRMGYSKEQMTAHGFRAMARTILDEVLGHPAEVIEQQLAHAVKDANGRAYNRTAYLPQRRRMMQAWADYLDALRDERKVITGRFGAGAANAAA